MKLGCEKCLLHSVVRTTGVNTWKVLRTRLAHGRNYKGVYSVHFINFHTFHSLHAAARSDIATPLLRDHQRLLTVYEKSPCSLIAFKAVVTSARGLQGPSSFPGPYLCFWCLPCSGAPGHKHSPSTNLSLIPCGQK